MPFRLQILLKRVMCFRVFKNNGRLSRLTENPCTLYSIANARFIFGRFVMPAPVVFGIEDHSQNSHDDMISKSEYRARQRLEAIVDLVKKFSWVHA